MSALLERRASKLLSTAMKLGLSIQDASAHLLRIESLQLPPGPTDVQHFLKSFENAALTVAKIRILRSRLILRVDSTEKDRVFDISKSSLNSLNFDGGLAPLSPFPLIYSKPPHGFFSRRTRNSPVSKSAHASSDPNRSHKRKPLNPRQSPPPAFSNVNIFQKEHDLEISAFTD
jgi:hypothetical protein